METINKYIIEPLQPDVFVNVWRNRGHSLYSEVANIDTSFSNELVTEEEVIKAYNPKDLYIEDYSSWLNSLTGDYKFVMDTEKYSATPKNYKIKLCNQMKRRYEEQHNFKYDCVIGFRPDTILFSHIPDYVMEDLDCVWQLNPPHIFNRNICHSMFHVMNSKVSDVYETYYDNLPHLWTLPYVEHGFTTKYDCTRTSTLHFREHGVRIRAYKKWYGFVETYRSEQDFNNAVSQIDDENERIIDAIISVVNNQISQESVDTLNSTDQNRLYNIIEWCEHYHFITPEQKRSLFA
jgi:hypothetical protein